MNKNTVKEKQSLDLISEETYENKIEVSYELLGLFRFFDSLSFDYKLFLNPEGLTFYVSEKDSVIDLIIYDNKYSYYACIRNKEYFADDESFDMIKDDILFKQFY